MGLGGGQHGPGNLAPGDPDRNRREARNVAGRLSAFTRDRLSEGQAYVRAQVRVDVEHDRFGEEKNASYHLLALKILRYLSTPGQHYHPEIAQRFALAAAADVLSHNLPAMAKILRNDPELRALSLEEEKKGEMNTDDFARVMLRKYPDLIMKFLCP
jgi:hypothetical protein